MVDKDKKFKFLIQKKTGIVHMWNKPLSERTDMIDFHGTMDNANAFGIREKKDFGGVEVEEVVEVVEKEVPAEVTGKLDEVVEEEDTYKVKRKRKKK